MTEKKNPLDLMTKMYLDGIKKAVELLKQNGNEITEETVAQKTGLPIEIVTKINQLFSVIP
ncbi:MAG TPA: hypothetical protein EYN66_15815 [Myxococcales bacterium]|nr:hypothetical protein [Myxococcales bacterium]